MCQDEKSSLNHVFHLKKTLPVLPFTFSHMTYQNIIYSQNKLLVILDLNVINLIY